MTTSTTLKQVVHRTDEKAWLLRLQNIVMDAHITSDPFTVTNIYVALKSKPLLLLVGAENQNKANFVRCLAHQLIGGDCLQCQILMGHPWWISPGHNLAFFSQVHSRFTSEKLMCLLEESILPQNHQKLFFAGLIKISPSELKDFFDDVSFQLQHDGVIRFGDLHLGHPIPFPATMHWIGTMDVNRFLWWEPDLLASTSVIRWSEEKSDQLACPVDGYGLVENLALLNPIRSEPAAYQRLYSVLNGLQQPLAPLFLLKNVLEKNGGFFPEAAKGDIAVYLANAWSHDGSGLFHHSAAENLYIAMDYALAQYLLPRILEPVNQRPGLRKSLEGIFRRIFPYSYEQLAWLL